MTYAEGSLNAKEVLEQTEGNYIFSVGFPGSGKTTFQWMMMRYLMEEGPFKPEIVEPQRSDRSNDWSGRRLIHDWKDQWRSGRLPESTSEDAREIREVRVSVSTTSGKSLKVDFSFLEMSGVLLSRVLPARSGPPKLAPLLDAYLKNTDLNLAVVFLLNPDEERNDHLFSTFLAYLRNKFPDRLEKMSLAVVLAKPYEALERLNREKSGRQYEELDEDALYACMNRFCGETHQIWDQWPDQRRIFLGPLYLGDIKDKEGEPSLPEPDFGDTEEIFFWLFEQFNGKRPGPTLWQKVMGNLDWK